MGADAILVHHGYFWRSEDAAITGIKKRVSPNCCGNDVSLLPITCRSMRIPNWATTHGSANCWAGGAGPVRRAEHCVHRRTVISAGTRAIRRVDRGETAARSASHRR